MSESECSKCKSSEWKTATMVMLEGVSGAQGSTAGEIQKDILASRIEGFFPGSDRWFDLERYSTHSSVQMETVSALAKAVEAAVADEGARLKFPEEPKEPAEPKEPSKPLRSRPKEMTFEPPKPLSRGEMWLHRRLGWVVMPVIAYLFFILSQEFPKAESFWAGLMTTLITPLVAWCTTHFGLVVTAAFCVFLLSGFAGLEKYNRKKFDEAESNFAKEKADYEPERLAAAKRYEEYDAQMADWGSEKERYPGHREEWVEQHREWESDVAKINDQRLALWNELRVCLRCAHVYRGPDPSKSLDLAPETPASKPPGSTFGESGFASELADTAVDALEHVTDKASGAASAAANGIKDIFNRDGSK